jgi:hypothetical protein
METKSVQDEKWMTTFKHIHTKYISTAQWHGGEGFFKNFRSQAVFGAESQDCQDMRTFFQRDLQSN